MPDVDTVDFAAQLARLTDLNDDDVRTLHDHLVTAFEAADTPEADVTAMTALADQLDQVRANMATRVVAEPVVVAETPAVPAVVDPPPAAVEAVEPVATPEAVSDPAAATVTDITPVPTTTTAEATPAPTTVTAQEGIPVAASATVAVPRGSEPIVADASGSRVFAGGGIPGFTAGVEITNADDFGKALTARINTLLRLNGGDGEQVVIASIKANDVSSDRVLDKNDPFGNLDKIMAVTSPAAITAAGGCCAPLVTKYDLFESGGVTDRPVRDGLASFRADRGGIRFWRAPVLADVQGALGFWTCADDTAADVATPSTWKVCARINCPPEETAELQAITLCLTFGVLQTRVFPELAVANNRLALVAQARLADSALLAQIKAGSTAVTDGGTPLGAVRDLLDCVGRATMYFRDRYRIKSAPLRAIFPAWLKEALRGDLVKGPDFGRPWGNFFGISEDEIASFFADRGLNVTWALDSAVPATLGGGFFPKLTTALPVWPTSVEWTLFVEGSWLFLDGGQLDLGIIRDSALVRVNDYMSFSESFEAAVNIGYESLWVTSAIDVSGKAQAPV